MATPKPVILLGARAGYLQQSNSSALAVRIDYHPLQASDSERGLHPGPSTPSPRAPPPRDAVPPGRATPTGTRQCMATETGVSLAGRSYCPKGRRIPSSRPCLPLHPAPRQMPLVLTDRAISSSPGLVIALVCDLMYPDVLARGAVTVLGLMQYQGTSGEPR